MDTNAHSESLTCIERPSRKAEVKMVPVVSSNVASIGHAPKARVLYVTFNGGALYRYADVPRFVYEGLLNAKSVGSMLAKTVKGIYDYELVQSA